MQTLYAYIHNLTFPIRVVVGYATLERIHRCLGPYILVLVIRERYEDVRDIL